ncbi:MAG: penicillin-binding protein, partial [Pseudomonadota bacterium]
VGFDTPRSLGEGEAGGRVAAPIFRDFMLDALANEPATPFRIPSGIQLIRVDAQNGRPVSFDGQNVILEAFKVENGLSEENGDLLGGPGGIAQENGDQSDAGLGGLY